MTGVICKVLSKELVVFFTINSRFAAQVSRSR
jgi:hypothetical protein